MPTPVSSMPASSPDPSSWLLGSSLAQAAYLSSPILAHRMADVSKNLHLATSKYKVAADRQCRVRTKSLPGINVWRSTKNICLRVPSIKCAPYFFGPFTVPCQFIPVAVKLCLCSYLRIPTVFHVSLLRLCILKRFFPFSSSSFSSCQSYRSV